MAHVVVVGIVEQGLGGNAADIEAGAAEGVVLFDADSLRKESMDML